ncbi:TPA: FAD-dependent oxidoreductase, partial [Klebsiella pneumoniae]|nr:FAD-dependent oxidoreductase [Klebsiella pneumoniae]
MQSVDVAIVGGGMVGLAVACGLQGSGLRVAVLEKA